MSRLPQTNNVPKTVPEVSVETQSEIMSFVPVGNQVIPSWRQTIRSQPRGSDYHFPLAALEFILRSAAVGCYRPNTAEISGD